MLEMYQMPAHLIRRLHQVSTQVFLARVQSTGHDVTPVQFATMQALAAFPGVEQAQVATLIGYDRATIGGVIDRLENKGFIRRNVSRRDRRAREVSLTEEGARVLQVLTPMIREVQDDIFCGLDQDEAEQFLTLLGKALASHAAAPDAPKD
ncbi:MarR family winged helix-turn-helix transcriptional regulator [Shimia sp.]|uniref:MarR family winged helix-turn-helix transcriptional regulator n=1 Tax=Shimia sp. TaxID=1954381 RepID=UPI003298CE61